MSWLARLFWLLLVPGAAELAARVYRARAGDALERSRPLLQPDPQLGWRQAPHLDLSFFGQRVQTNALGWRAPELSELQGKKLILVLGPSSAFGWGVRAGETYALRLEALLPGHTVINAGEIGFSSFQGLRMLDWLAVRELKPFCIVVAYGVNDVDRHRFLFQSALPDHAELATERDALSLLVFRALRSSALLSLGYRAAGSWTAPAPPGLRVPPGEFAKNLGAMAARAQELGARVVLLGTAVRLPALPEKNAPSGSALRLEAGKLEELGKLSEAESALELAARLDPGGNEAVYELARLAARQGRGRDAQEHLRKARALEPLRIHRDVLRYNEIMRETAAALRLPFVEIQGLLGGREENFVDPIHPSAAGHRRIAEALSLVLR